MCPLYIDKKIEIFLNLRSIVKGLGVLEIFLNVSAFLSSLG